MWFALLSHLIPFFLFLEIGMFSKSVFYVEDFYVNPEFEKNSWCVYILMPFCVGGTLSFFFFEISILYRGLINPEFEKNFWCL